VLLINPFKITESLRLKVKIPLLVIFQHCPFWRTEIDTAIHFYKALTTEDPTYCLRLFGDDL
jgi:hypothetical protein